MFLTFWGFGGQVGSGSEKVEKRRSENQKNLNHFEKISVFFSTCVVCVFFEVSLDVFFVFFVARMCQTRVPWDHFSRHFLEKLESWNLCFRVGQTAFFMVFRGWVWRSWVTLFKLFFKVAWGMVFYDFCWNLGSKQDPINHFFVTFDAINSRAIFWWFSDEPERTNDVVKCLPGGALWSYLAKAK